MHDSAFHFLLVSAHRGMAHRGMCVRLLKGGNELNNPHNFSFEENEKPLQHEHASAALLPQYPPHWSLGAPLDVLPICIS